MAAIMKKIAFLLENLNSLKIFNFIAKVKFYAIIWNKICYIIFVKFSLGVAVCKVSLKAS